MPCFFNAFGIVHTSSYGARFCDCGATRNHAAGQLGRSCSCAECRHDRFNPGPPSMTKRQRRNHAHAEALIENEERSLVGRTQA